MSADIFRHQRQMTCIARPMFVSLEWDGMLFHLYWKNFEVN